MEEAGSLLADSVRRVTEQVTSLASGLQAYSGSQAAAIRATALQGEALHLVRVLAKAPGIHLIVGGQILEYSLWDGAALC